MTLLIQNARAGLTCLLCSMVIVTELPGATRPAGSGPAAYSFRPLMPSGQMKAAIQEMNVDQILKDFTPGSQAFPACGVQVLRLKADSLLREAGGTPGCVMVSRASFRYLPTLFQPADHSDRLAGDLVWVTPGNEPRSHPMPEGLLGFQTYPFRSMSNWYLRHGQRNPKWDRQVLTALLQQENSPALAESCWAAAIALGYRPDRLSHWSGMMLALANRDYPRAESYAEQFGQPEPVRQAGDLPVLSYDWQQLALLTGNPQWLMRVAGFFPGRDCAPQLESVRGHVELFKQLPAGTPPPSELAKAMKHRSFLRNSDTNGIDMSKSDLTNLHWRAAVAVGAPDPVFPAVVVAPEFTHFYRLWFSPKKPAANLDVEIRFQGQGQPVAVNELENHGRSLTFGLADRDHHGLPADDPSDDARVMLTELSYGYDDLAYLPWWRFTYAAISGVPAQTDNLWRCAGPIPGGLVAQRRSSSMADPNEVHTLRVVRVNGQAEALLDGRRLALVQVPPELKNPGLFLEVNGCKISVTALRADVLE